MKLKKGLLLGKPIKGITGEENSGISPGGGTGTIMSTDTLVDGGTCLAEGSGLCIEGTGY
jgi:hypothetical protein